MMPISAFSFSVFFWGGEGGGSRIKMIKKEHKGVKITRTERVPKKCKQKRRRKHGQKKCTKKCRKKGNLKMAENDAFKSAKNSKLLSKVH